MLTSFTVYDDVDTPKDVFDFLNKCIEYYLPTIKKYCNADNGYGILYLQLPNNRVCTKFFEEYVVTTSTYNTAACTVGSMVIEIEESYIIPIAVVLSNRAFNCSLTILDGEKLIDANQSSIRYKSIKSKYIQ